jgi:hypothetical protein
MSLPNETRQWKDKRKTEKFKCLWVVYRYKIWVCNMIFINPCVDLITFQMNIIFSQILTPNPNPYSTNTKIMNKALVFCLMHNIKLLHLKELDKMSWYVAVLILMCNKQCLKLNKWIENAYRYIRIYTWSYFTTEVLIGSSPVRWRINMFCIRRH